jgi:hypothetical protein
VRVFENRVLRGIYESKTDKVTTKWENRMMSSIICTYPQISLGRSNQGERIGRGMWHARDRTEKCTRFWWESPKERDHLEDRGVDERMESKWVLGELARRVCSGFIWLRRGMGGSLL